MNNNMAEHKPNFVVKRQPEGTNEPDPKHPRTGESPATKSMKLTDVVNDCLERIFMHLSLEDLLNIAHTNKDLKPAADMAFQRKFSKIEFELCNGGYDETNRDYIIIADKKTQLRLLRCYGHVITKLDIAPYDEFGKKLICYANEYCFDSLISIRICDFYIRNHMMQKPFSNVEVVELYRCRLYTNMNFKKWFPAMQRLDLNWCSTFTKEMFIVKNIPQLEHLAIHCNRDIPSENICTSLQNNPQLRSLILFRMALTKELWNTCQSLGHLECLKIDCIDVFKHVDTPINLRALKILDINILRVNDLRVLFSEMTFDQLEEITLHLTYTDINESDIQWLNFFNKHQSVKKFTLNSFHCYINENTMTAITQTLPSLKEFNHFAGYFQIR